MIGGESWPALARPVRAGEGGEAQQAVEVLLRGRDDPRARGRHPGDLAAPARPVAAARLHPQQGEPPELVRASRDADARESPMAVVDRRPFGWFAGA